MTKRDKQILEFNLKRKYQALFRNLFEFNGTDYMVDDFIMGKLLHTGEIAGFKLLSPEEISIVGFGSFVRHNYDMYGNPLTIRILNERQSPYVPTQPLVVNKDTVIMKLDFIPQEFINMYVDKIMEIESAIRINLQNNKTPFVITSSDPKTLKAIEDLLNDETVIAVNDRTIQVLTTNPPYIIDKLYKYKTEVESELLTLLGIDNVKFEKSAQMNVDEVNANNDEVNAYRTIIKDKIEAFFNQMNTVLGTSLSIKSNVKETQTKENENDLSDNK